NPYINAAAAQISAKMSPYDMAPPRKRAILPALGRESEPGRALGRKSRRRNSGPFYFLPAAKSLRLIFTPLPVTTSPGGMSGGQAPIHFACWVVVESLLPINGGSKCARTSARYAVLPV